MRSTGLGCLARLLSPRCHKRLPIRRRGSTLEPGRLSGLVRHIGIVVFPICLALDFYGIELLNGCVTYSGADM